jgi:hypothetical protein
MGDGGWTLGLATLLSIFGGAGLYAWAVLRSMPKLTLPEPDDRPAPKEDLRVVLQMQASASEARNKYRQAMGPLDRWVEIAIRHLMHLWPSMTYDEAARGMRAYLEDAIKAWPSKDWDWSDDAAREMAVEYTREYGERYGANQ